MLKVFDMFFNTSMFTSPLSFCLILSELGAVRAIITQLKLEFRSEVEPVLKIKPMIY